MITIASATYSVIETSSVLPKNYYYYRNFRLSSEIFGNLRKLFGECSETSVWPFGIILENLRKSSESGQEYSENCQKRRHKYVYIINRILHARFLDTNFIFCSTRYLTRSLHSLLRYRVEHSKIKFVSTSSHVISSIYLTCCYL